jgi:hypothetical protein
MFDLEKSIADWRQQMLTAGIQTPVPLDELESHLREEIERQTKSGLYEQEAFNVAVRRIGQASMLKTEFKKVERKHMKRVLIISAGVIGVLAGMAFVMPAVAQYRHEGAMTLNETCLLLLGFGLTLGGGSVAVFTFRKRKA